MFSLQPFSHLESAGHGRSGLAGSILQGLLQRSALQRDLNWDLHKFGPSVGRPTSSDLKRRVSCFLSPSGTSANVFLVTEHMVREVVTTFPAFILNYFCHIFSPSHRLPNIIYSYYLFVKAKNRQGTLQTAMKKTVFLKNVYFCHIHFTTLFSYSLLILTHQTQFSWW